jgi:hypothetical protein
MTLTNILKRGFLPAAAALTIVSCSNDNLSDPAIYDGNVTFSATLADAPATRAFGDGQSAVNLMCAVYDQNGKLVTTKEAIFNNLKANVTLQLLDAETYDIVFFAYRDNGVYAFDTATGKVTIDYSKMNQGSADGARIDDDCFYVISEDYVAGSSAAESVTLTRPVAQINFGSDDLESEAAGRDFPDGINAAMTMTAYPVLNVLTGEAEGEPTEVKLPLMEYDEALAAEAFPVAAEGKTYKYVAMGYALVPAEGYVADLGLEVFNGAAATTPKVALSVPTAPMKRNYRTNIYGSLLTSTSDWNIIIDENWEGEWNIGDYAGDAALAQGGEVRVNTPVDAITVPAELDKPLTLDINATVGTINIGETSQPVTINVAKDVEYPAIAFERGSNIKGLTVTGDPTSDKSLGSFNFNKNGNLVRPAVLEDLTLEGVTFVNEGFTPQYAVTTKNTVLRNCRFTEMTSPAVAVQHHGNGAMTAENMTIEGCTIEMADDAASNANALYLLDIEGDVIVKDNIIKNAAYHGMFLSTNTAGLVFDATVTGNTITGAAQDGVKIENCLGGITVDDNTIDCKVNGIRIKNSITTADVSVQGNSIDMKNAIAWDGDSEPSAILLVNSAENAGAKVVVKGNTALNSNGHNFTVKNVVYADGSDVATPFN